MPAKKEGTFQSPHTISPLTSKASCGRMLVYQSLALWGDPGIGLAR
jgi:hypothetical protein